MDKIDLLKEIISKSRYLVFFGGAGVSTESNIPDFRSEKGLYNAINTYGYSPEEMISIDFFMRNRIQFFRYYKENLIHSDAMPNDAHYALAKLEQMGILKAVITQNIDGLHQKSGSKEVLELHGSVYRNKCIRCGSEYTLEYIMKFENVPECGYCGAVVKPEVVLYGEGLDQNVVDKSILHIRNADTLIVGGTSLVVYPAAGLIRYFNGEKLVLINRTETVYDKKADLVINENIGEVLGKAVKPRT